MLKRALPSSIAIRWRLKRQGFGTGNRRSKTKGFGGFDLESISAWQEDIDEKHIKWSLSARSGFKQLLVARYFQDIESTIFVVADCSRTMDFGTVRTTKRVLSAEVAASTIQSAAKEHDKVGVVTFNEQGFCSRSHLKPKSPNQQLLVALVSILEGRPNPVKDGTLRPVVSGMAAALKCLPRHRSLVVLLSDFLNLSDEDKKQIARTARCHDLAPCILEDIRERELPDGRGVLALEDIRNSRRTTIPLFSKKSRQDCREWFSTEYAKRHRELTAFLKQCHCRFEVFSTEEERTAVAKKIMRLLKYG